MTDNYQTDGCTSPACSAALGGNSSLTQGQQFANMTKTFHGGHRRQSGGAAEFPGGFSQTLPQDMHQAANIAPLDAAFNDLPNFIGKYGMSGGSRKNRKANRKGRKASRKERRKGRKNSRKGRKASRKGRKASRKERCRSRRSMRGGMSPIGAPSMLLTPAEESAAMLNPQWYNENQVVPSFKGPSNPYAEQQYANQIKY
jgi:hypothetical protein